MRRYDLTLAAEADLKDIWRYTHDRWGFDQAERYLDQIEAGCEAIAMGLARAKRIEGLPDTVSVHRCEHHYIVWIPGDRPIIIAILHERMHFFRQLQRRLA